MIRIGVILGSVRAGRNGERVGRWVMRRLARVPEVEAILLDLRDFPLPHLAEAEEPSHLTRYADDVANRWAEAVASMDGFVIVTPEYNHGYPGVLKNALDYLYAQWNGKPVSFVSYSTGAVGGARSVEQLRPVAGNLRLVVLPEAVHLGKVHELMSPEGELLSGRAEAALDAQLAKTAEWARMPRTPRAQTGKAS